MEELLPLAEDLTSNIAAEILEQAIYTRFPSPTSAENSQLSKEEKVSAIAEKFRGIMEILGLDLNDESLQHTPYRVARMYVEEVFSGLDPASFPRVSFIEDRFRHNDRSSMVFVKSSFCSFCEHHFVPMEGTASVAYLPNGKLIGLSKIPRIVRFFARRPQVQERLAAQIADALATLLGTDSVAVSLHARHHCITARGVENESSHAITNVLRGEFETDELMRKEFFDALNRPCQVINRPN